MDAWPAACANSQVARAALPTYPVLNRDAEAELLGSHALRRRIALRQNQPGQLMPAFVRQVFPFPDAPEEPGVVQLPVVLTGAPHGSTVNGQIDVELIEAN